MYLQHPVRYQDNVFFMSGDRLWRGKVTGGAATCLTDVFTGVSGLLMSPDGENIYFVYQGDAYVISIIGGVPQRLTHEGSIDTLIGWERDVASHPRLWGIIRNPGFERTAVLIRTHTDASGPVGHITPWAYGPCAHFSENSQGHLVLQRHGYGYASWKRYQGGTAATLWVDPHGDRHFVPLLPQIKHNKVSPIWVAERIYFLCDHEDHGHIYSCTATGEDLKQHTQHDAFYPRQLSHWHHHLMYQRGGVLWTYDTSTHEEQRLDIVVPMGALNTMTEQKNPHKYLTSVTPSPKGTHLALTTRGRLLTMTPHRGPAMQRGIPDGVRYRWALWCADHTLVALVDHGTYETLEHFGPHGEGSVSTLSSTDFPWGRLVAAVMHPKEPVLIGMNQKHELLWINLKNPAYRVLDHSRHGPLLGFSWSPCGRWIAYSLWNQRSGSSIQLKNISTWLEDSSPPTVPCPIEPLNVISETDNRSTTTAPSSSLDVVSTQCDDSTHSLPTYTITDARFWNTDPVFDPQGKYLYFLSSRDFSPQWDDLGLSMGCYDVVRPYVCVLQADQESPFVSPLWPEKNTSTEPSGKESDASIDTKQENKDKNSSDESKAESTTKGSELEPNKVSSPEPSQTTRIDTLNISDRIQAFPLAPKAYHGLWALSDTLWYGVKNDEGHYDLFAYDLKTLKEDPMVSDVTHMGWSLDREWMTYRTVKNKLRTVRTNAKPDDSPDTSFHQGGWLDWSRVPLIVNPQKEWRHMFDEAWRLQKEMFWMPHMGHVDWDAMYRRHQPCVDRITCLSELYSLISDLQGELGTSHAYVMPPKTPIKSSDVLGTLGCIWTYCPTHRAYRIDHIYEGDDRHPVPLRRPGVNVKKGDLVHTLAGQALSPENSPDMLLGRFVGHAMTMTVSDGLGSGPARTVMVFPVAKSRESRWIYRQWVNRCRTFVHQETNDRVGYIHIPDMQEEGMREFLMGYTQEFDKEGLIVDVRYNAGGNLSYIMLDYLRRQRLGYDQSRHHGMIPYPAHSPKGPMVAIANEYTGSDGDIFSHAFKNLNLGPLIGKRTWGGVVGIWTRYDLMDGTVTSQPEFSFWLQDVGWGIENQGVEPTIDVDITPMDSAQNKDPQLIRAIQEIQKNIDHDQPRQAPLIPPEGSEPRLASRWQDLPH